MSKNDYPSVRLSDTTVLRFNSPAEPAAPGGGPARAGE
jgi:hypothetical protein